MRLFIAVNLPPGEQDRIAAATRQLRDGGLPVRWVAPDAYHLTLKFLGEVSPPVADALTEVVRDVALRHRAFPLRLRGTGVFPNLRRPAVWWIGSEPSAPLSALQRDVERAVAPLGFEPEQRAFSAHLTLGRTTRDAPPGALAGAGPLLQSVDLDRTITIETLDLMRSHLSPRGARYERVCAASFRP